MNREYKKRLLREQDDSTNDFNSFLSSSRSSARQSIGDRFIPCRTSTAWHNFSLLQENIKTTSQTKKFKPSNADCSKDGTAYSFLLKNELLGASFENVKEQMEDREVLNARDTRNMNLFTYQIPRQDIINEVSSPYSLSPLNSRSQKLLCSSKKIARKISGVPFKILDARGLKDDFYLNLVDWSSTNILSIGLGTRVYLWNACTSQVAPLCDLSSGGDAVTSVSWTERGDSVAVGTHKGYVQVWDVATAKCNTVFTGHSARVGAIAWNGDILTSGSRDRSILQRDIRTSSSTPNRQLVGHRQEVCGLKWSPDNRHLASGGNDNKLFVWNLNALVPIQTYEEHVAAVKAIAWSPHHHGLLASGGGSADRCIRFWDTLTKQPMQQIDTGSQVCNLAWSKHTSELVSTHGYSRNQISIWKYPSLTTVAKLTGHSCRVLYFAMSPDGECIVTGAGDETLRLWNVFSKAPSQKKEAKSALNLFTSIR